MNRWFVFFLSMVLMACNNDHKESSANPEDTDAPVDQKEEAFKALQQYEEVYVNTLTKADNLADSIFTRLSRIEDTLSDPKYLSSSDIIDDREMNQLWAEASKDPSIVQARARIIRDLDGTRFDFKLDPNLLIGIEETRFDTLLYGLDITGGYGVSTTEQKGLEGLKMVEIENADGDRKEGLTIFLRMFMAYEKKNVPG